MSTILNHCDKPAQKHKLIRDKIPSFIGKKGESALITHATVSEFRDFLFEKLHEETLELKGAVGKKNQREEMADIIEVLAALRKEFQISPKSIEIVRKKKKKERGGFSKRLVLEHVSQSHH